MCCISLNSFWWNTRKYLKFSGIVDCKYRNYNNWYDVGSSRIGSNYWELAPLRVGAPAGNLGFAAYWWPSGAVHPTLKGQNIWLQHVLLADLIFCIQCSSVNQPFISFTLEFFRIEFFRIYRIYRIPRRLFLVIFIFKMTKTSILQNLQNLKKTNFSNFHFQNK